MKAVILAGGLGTRLAELTDVLPKPMVEVGNRPILWHVMKIYSQHGINEFIICCGYKGYVIKEYFANYLAHNSNMTIDLATGTQEYHECFSEPWKVTLVDTGVQTQTGGRLKRVAPFLTDSDFCFTYGDGLSNHDVGKSIAFHHQHRKLATVTAVQPPGRFGVLQLNDEEVTGFVEKPAGDNSWINGGYFVLSRNVLEKIKNDETVWEKEPMEDLARGGNLKAYLHHGFWQPMDTLREKRQLDELWNSNRAPWKTWS